MKLNLRIITAKGDFLHEDVDSLTLRLTSGYRTILPEHAPLIGIADYAPMHVVKDGKMSYYALHGGLLNVKKEETLLIANGIEAAESIDLARAEAAKARALKRLALNAPRTDIKRAQLALSRALSRISAYNAWKS